MQAPGVLGVAFLETSYRSEKSRISEPAVASEVYFRDVGVP